MTFDFGVGAFLQGLVASVGVDKFATNIVGIEWGLLIAFVLVLIFGNTLLRIIALALIALLFFGVINI